MAENPASGGSQDLDIAGYLRVMGYNYATDRSIATGTDMKPQAKSKKFLRKFGLSRDPFPGGAVDEVLYLTPELERRLSLIREHVDEGDHLVIVIAPDGGGKTRIAWELQKAGHKGWSTGLVNAKPALDANTLAYGMLSAVAPDKTGSVADSVDRLQNYLESAAKRGTKPVFVIDDAHLLPVETLDYILQLLDVKYRDTGFSFVLFADDTINDRLDDPKIMVLPNTSYVYLPSFSAAQTAEYIRHRLLSCGLNREDPFRDSDIDYIHKVSGGLPRGINYLARETLQGYAGGAGGLWRGLVTVLLLVVFGGGAYLLLQRQPVPGTELVAVVPPEFEATGVDVQDMSGQPEPEPVASPVSGEPEAMAALLALSAESNPVVEPITAAGLEPTPAETETTGLSDQASSGLPSPAATPEPVVEDADETAGVVEDVEDVIAFAAPEPVEQEAAAEIAPRSAGTTAKLFDLEEVPDWAADIHGEDWIRQQAEGSYFLQLISARDIGNIEKLLRGVSGIEGELSGYTVYTPSGKSRYRLYYGVFPDRAAAKAGVNGLPDTLQRLKPWPRSYSGLIKEITSKSTE